MADDPYRLPEHGDAANIVAAIGRLRLPHIATRGDFGEGLHSTGGTRCQGRTHRTASSELLIVMPIADLVSRHS